MPPTQSREHFVLVDSEPSPVTKELGDPRLSYIENCYGNDFQMAAQLMKAYPDHILTIVPNYNADLLAFADDGKAIVTLDTKTAPYLYKQGVANNGTGEKPPWIIKNIAFGKYGLTWQGHDFTMFIIAENANGPGSDDGRQFILRKPSDASEVQKGESAVSNALLLAVGQWQVPKGKSLYVYDNGWFRSAQLYKEVEKASWDDVILSSAMKHDLTHVVTRFFDSKSVYEELGVPWKRGIIFHGVAGNGKTISVKAIMNTLTVRADPIPTLYVKQAMNVNDIRLVFQLARRLAPCCLVLEDIETIVNEYTRSYFFNEVDGLERNDGILLIGSTNHLEDLDPGLSKRPNRFDRKYLFPLPSADDRALYVDYWRAKVAKKSSVYFPKSLSTRVAALTKGFTFAYMQEAFVTALLVLAGQRSDATMSVSREGAPGSSGRTRVDVGGKGEEDDDCELYAVLEREILALKAEMDTSDEALNGGDGDGAGGPRNGKTIHRSGRRHAPQPLPPYPHGHPHAQEDKNWNPFAHQVVSWTNQRIPRNVG